MAGKGVVILKNKEIELMFCKKTGSLMQIADKVVKKKYLSRTEGARLFRVMLPLDDWPTHYADSHLNNNPELKEEEGCIDISFKNLKDIRGKSTGIDVRVRVSLLEGSTEALFAMEIENKGRHTVEQVRFPWVGGLEAVAGHGKDRVTIASKSFDLHGLLPMDNPHTFSRWREKIVFDYPFPLLLPYLDISGGGRGIGYICYLEKPLNGTLGFERLDPFEKHPSLSFAWASNPFVKPGGKWSSPEVGISLHRGDWHKTAGRFRAWVDGWWKNPCPPANLKESIGMGNLQFTGFSGETIHRFSQLPALAEEFLKAGVSHICLWHRAGGLYEVNGSTKEIMDEPPAVLKELKTALAEVNKKGVNMNIILNLRLLKNIFAPYGEIGEKEAMRAKDGSPASRETYSGSPYHLNNSGPGYNLGDSVALCQRLDSPFSARAEKIIKKMLDLGFTSIFIDQPVNQQCCFAAHHNHSSPDMAHKECVDWIAAVARQVKSRSEEAYIIGELPELFQTQNMDLWWHWQWKYLVPEVFRYSHPDSLQMWVIDGDVGEMNRAFVLGFLLNLTPAGMEKGMGGRPEVVKQCSLLSALKKKAGKALTETRFMDREGLTIKKGKGVDTAVYAGKDMAAVTIAETGNAPAQVELSFNPVVHNLKFSKGVLYRTGGKQEKTAVSPGGVHSLKTKLQPHEAAVWKFNK